MICLVVRVRVSSAKRLRSAHYPALFFAPCVLCSISNNDFRVGGVGCGGDPWGVLASGLRGSAFQVFRFLRVIFSASSLMSTKTFRNSPQSAMLSVLALGLRGGGGGTKADRVASLCFGHRWSCRAGVML